MISSRRIIVFPLVLSSCLALAEKVPFERYQSIIDRQMFGPLPKDFDPTKMPSEVSKGSGSSAAERELTKEQAQLQSAIHFSVINVDRDGKAVVGFTDNSDPKAPVHYYLRVGESQNEWTVKEADVEHATMKIVKGDIEVELKLGENSGKGGGRSAAAANAPAANGHRSLLSGGSLRARRAAREQAAQEDEKKRAAEAAEKEAERQAQAEQEKAEREAERAQQRQQLMAIQEELRKAREEKERQRQSEGSDEKNDAE